MFQIRVVTPAVVDETGRHLAGGAFTLGHQRLLFLVDLGHWGVADYQRQWHTALERLARGALATALFTAYRGPDGGSHVAWALWREGDWVYVQEQIFLPAELPAALDPWNPDSHVGRRLKATEQELPIAEWRTELVNLFASVFHIRFPFLPS